MTSYHTPGLALPGPGPDAAPSARRCIVCHRILRTPESVARGFGPRCARRLADMFGPEKTAAQRATSLHITPIPRSRRHRWFRPLPLPIPGPALCIDREVAGTPEGCADLCSACSAAVAEDALLQEIYP